MPKMNRPARLAGAAAASTAAAALLTACTGISASPVGGNLGTPLPAVGAPSTSATTAAATTAAAPCTQQTANISGDSATKIAQTMAAEMPKGCGFTLVGTLESPAEQVDGAQIEGSATYDSSGDLHFALLDQGVVLDTYVIGGSTYLRMYEESNPNAAPDADVKSLWQGALSTAAISQVGTGTWVKLTSAQLSTMHLAPGQHGVTGFSTLSSVTAMAADLTNADGETWESDGTKTVNGVPCALIDHAASSAEAPETAIAVDQATGLPVQVSYSHGSTVILATFSDWDTTPTIATPNSVVDGAALG